MALFLFRSQRNLCQLQWLCLLQSCAGSLPEFPEEVSLVYRWLSVYVSDTHHADAASDSSSMPEISMKAREVKETSKRGSPML